MWEMVIGLETHVELSTKTKIFCGCTTQFGGEPNTHCCPVCTGQPGSLPVLNETVVEYAATAGLALDCQINRVSKMDRKHYVYPDLPKAYQISQFDKPLCEHGKVELSNGRTIRILRIHIEEDAGKLVHQGGEILMDYNRGGVPLIEIVTEPDFRSKEEVIEYLEYLQTTMRAVGVSDCRMQEGSLRCDVNISLRREGDTEFGIRTEVKNLNSFSSVAAAIEYEYDRQADILSSGGKVVQETLHFNADTGETVNMRGKENADDYRYFPEPDIITIVLPDDTLTRLRDNLPEMPHEKEKRYISDFDISAADAKLLTKYRRVSEYFDEASEGLKTPKTVATLMITQMFSQITTESEREQWNPPVTAAQLKELVCMLEAGKINRNLTKRVFSQMMEDGKPATEFISEEDLAGFDPAQLVSLCRQAVDENPKSVSDFKLGKEKALKALVGSVMRQSKGRANALEAEKEIRRIIGE